jgi:CSLREA domain-containing protein
MKIKFISFTLICIWILALTWSKPVAASSTSLTASTYTVTRFDDPALASCSASDCSLREAVIAANLHPGSTVVIQAGTYTLAQAGANEDGAATGDLDIYGAMTISGAGAAKTTINGGGLDRVFQVLPTGNATISGVTITNGFVAAGTDYGGGGLSNSGTLVLSNCVVTGNHTENFGGGIDNSGNLKLIGTTVSHNTVSGGDFSNGGGIYNGPVAANPGADSLTLLNSIIEDNSALDNGGGLNNNGPSALTNSIVRNNTAGSGGGIFNNGAGSLTLAQSAIVANTANSTVGGGIDNEGPATITNTTISGNSASQITRGKGGGIYNNGMLTLLNVTIAFNQAPAGGPAVDNDATFNMTNTILTSSDAAASGNCIGTAAITSGGHNLEFGDSCGLHAAGDQVNANPNLGPLQINDSFTPTHALLSGSPAIDAGDSRPSVCPATDQRGYFRPQDGNEDGVSACDIGAFEVGIRPTYTFIPVVMR